MYRVSRRDVEFEVSNIDKTVQEIAFTSSFPSGCAAVDRSRAVYYRSNGSDEAVVFVHGSGRHFKRFLYYPRVLSQNGYHTVMPILPYHYERVCPGNDVYATFIKGTSEVLEKKYAQAVVDVMTCIDYLEQNGIRRIHLMGYSLGGMIAAITAAIDKRIEKTVLVLAGGNFEYITWDSTATRVFRVKYEEDESCDKNKCHEIHREFDRAAREWTELDDLKRYPSCFRYDPSFFANRLHPEHVMMVTALCDECVPRRSSDDLWKRLGKPKRLFVPSTHLTAHLFCKGRIMRESLVFLGKAVTEADV